MHSIVLQGRIVTDSEYKKIHCHLIINVFIVHLCNISKQHKLNELGHFKIEQLSTNYIDIYLMKYF